MEMMGTLQGYTVMGKSVSPAHHLPLDLGLLIWNMGLGIYKAYLTRQSGEQGLIEKEHF